MIYLFTVLVLLLSACGKGVYTQNLSVVSGTSSGDDTPASSSCSSDSYCIIFVSNTTTTADIDGGGDDDGTNGIEEADDICMSDANKPTSGTYKAMLSDGTNRIACTSANCSGGTAEHTDWVLKPSKEYRRTDETTIIGTTTADGVFSFNLTNSIATAGTVWTGLRGDWRAQTNDCSDWTTSAGSTGSNGFAPVTNSIAIFNSAVDSCGNSRPVYCVEQ
jgi:hypothetical protein